MYSFRYEKYMDFTQIIMSNFHFIAIIFLLIISYSNSSESPNDQISPLLKMNSDPSNPGIFMRLMPTGIAYLREIGMKTINDQLLRIKLPMVTEKVDAGQVSIYNAYVAKYWSPPEYNLELSPSDMFTWSMSKMHIQAVGDFEVTPNNPLLLPTVPIRGQFETLFGQISLAIAVKLGRNGDGAPMVRSTFCHADVGYVDLNVRNTGVITDFFINSFKAFIIVNFKPIVEDRICKMIKKVVNDDMNEILSTMPLQIRLNANTFDIIGETFGFAERHKFKFRPIGVYNISLTNVIENLRKRNLVLDYRLIRDPVIADGSIGILIKGEISENGFGGTPFDPPNVQFPQPNGVHMLEIFATDYIANSMFYHAYRQRYMDMVIGPESDKQLQSLLVTSCSTGFCIGESLGSLGEKFPNREVEIDFTARRSPILVFVRNRARFRLHGRMSIFVRPMNKSEQKTMILRSDTTMTCNVKLWINGSNIIGNASVENLDFKLKESSIEDITQETVSDLGLFGAEFLEKLLTNMLKIGIPIPAMKGVHVKNPVLTLHERYIMIRAFFKLDEQLAGKLVEGAVRQSLKNLN